MTSYNISLLKGFPYFFPTENYLLSNVTYRLHVKSNYYFQLCMLQC